MRTRGPNRSGGLMEYMEAKMQAHLDGYDAQVRELLEQRDALLSALKAIIASENGFYRVAMPASLREAASAAIAKAEGQ